MRQKWWKW